MEDKYHSVGEGSVKAKALNWFASSVGFKGIFALLLLLASSSLTTTFLADDYYLAARIISPGLLPEIETLSTWSMFSVSDGTAETVNQLKNQGLMPWWTSEQFKFNMFRPLVEFTHWLDFYFWPNQPALMHFHQMLWVLFFFGAAFLFFREFCDSDVWVKAALVIFAFSANHTQTIAWLAGRNTLISGALSMLAIVAHLRWVQSGKGGYGFVACLLFCLGLAASELGVSVLAWIIAFALFLDCRSVRSKLLSLCPYAVITLAWLAIYTSGNHGVTDSEYYLDPQHSPLGYTVALLEKVPTMLFTSLLHLPAGLFGSSKWFGVGWWIALSVAIVFIWLTLQHKEKNKTAFFLVGSALSMVPISAGAGGARTLVFVSLGVTALSSRLIIEWVAERKQGAVTFLKAILVGIVLTTTLISVLTLPITSFIYSGHNKKTVANPAQSLSRIDDISSKTVVFINPESVLYSIFYPLNRSIAGLDNPQRFYAFTSGKKGVTAVERDSENSLIIEPQAGFLSEGGAYFMRRKAQGFEVGQRIPLQDIDLEVLALTDDQRPSRVRVLFKTPLQSENLVMLKCENKQVERLDDIAVGASLLLDKC